MSSSADICEYLFSICDVGNCLLKMAEAREKVASFDMGEDFDWTDGLMASNVKQGKLAKRLKSSCIQGDYVKALSLE